MYYIEYRGKAIAATAPYFTDEVQIQIISLLTGDDLTVLHLDLAEPTSFVALEALVEQFIATWGVNKGIPLGEVTWTIL